MVSGRQVAQSHSHYRKLGEDLAERFQWGILHSLQKAVEQAWKKNYRSNREEIKSEEKMEHQKFKYASFPSAFLWKQYKKIF